MNTTFTFGISLICYLIVTCHFMRCFQTGNKINRPFSIALLCAGVLFHGLTLYPAFHTPHGIDFSLFNVISLTTLLMLGFSLLFSSYRPIIVLNTFAAPLAALGLVLGFLLHPEQAQPIKNNMLATMQLHIVLSIAAYSVLFMAAVQAVLLRFQNRELKHKSIHRVWVKLLPALQTMESLLFDMILAGFCLLSFALAFGWFGVTDILAQHLAHKTVFSVLAWVLFAWLIFGHWKFGWRGKRAANITLVGFGLLALGFVGTKAVMELIL